MTRAQVGQELLNSGAVVPAVWRADLLCGQINALRFAGQYTEALQRAEGFYEAAAGLTHTASALAAFALGQTMLDVGRLGRAEEILREALALLRQEDVLGVLPWCMCSLAQSLALSGNIAPRPRSTQLISARRVRCTHLCAGDGPSAGVGGGR